MYNYVSKLLLILVIVITAVLMILYHLIEGTQRDIISTVNLFLFVFPISVTASIMITYTFFMTDNKLSTIQSKNNTSAFTPSILLAISSLLILLLLQEIVMPYLVKQKLMKEGTRDVIFALDDKKYILAQKVYYDSKTKNYILKNVKLLTSTLSELKSIGNIIYVPSINTLRLGKEIRLEGNLEKIFTFYVNKNYFMSIWEFNQVKDSFYIFNIKPSFLNFVMYEKIFIPLISFVIMLFTITLSWSWRIRRNTRFMPLYIIVGGLLIVVAVNMIYYLSIRLFEFLVFPF
ncbi:MAG: hypothetical protein ACP5PT_01640 [Brevinematia bacterium]